MTLSNYELLDKISTSAQSDVFKAHHKKNLQQPLILKFIKTPLSESRKAQIRQKIEHFKVLNDPLLITPLVFGDKDGACFITHNYFEGIALSKFMEKQPKLALKDFFTIAISLARALEKVHDAGIIHGGVKPHNILINPSSLEIRLIDFISAVDVRDISHFIYNPSFIRNTLAYTSPEQTGRINHRVVFSSDLYSLGILFYEMLTRQAPFQSSDPLELIHLHLAHEAQSAAELNPKIPSVLSNIVAKLMLKEPEKRYQTSLGLYNDLVRCREEFLSTGTIREFPLEKSVTTQRVTFISKMVGRDKEAKVILDEFERVSSGKFRSVFISGLSGIGKTRLIQELQKPIVKHRGYFTSGKFDVYQKNVPYSSLIQALSNLMRTFLTESDERLSIWRKKILGAVGQEGKLLSDVIPELEILIGTQPELPTLPPVESLNRFHDVFDRFLGCLGSADNPLTFFIDDLQWCDSASFDFLTNLFANYKSHPYLFFLGAYRHNEVDSSHPLTRLIKTVKDNRQPIKEIKLGPLNSRYCHEMVSYILDSPLSHTEVLSGFLSTLTEGNPLFVSESLSYLHNQDLLFLDSKSQWQWDMEKIRNSRMPNTVVELFSSKIQTFQSEIKDLLEYCACMGNSFSPAELALIKDMSLVKIFEILKPALGRGLLIENKSRLQFVHDKVQEAALSALSAERRRFIHWHVGNHLFSNVAPKEDIENVENLFTIVSHLNLGREEKPDRKTAYFLSDLNFKAGNKALNSLATQAANEYYKLSCELLPKDAWKNSHYKQTFRIFQKAAKTELMCGNYEKSEKLLNYLLDHAKTDLDKAECLAEQTTSLSSVGNFIKAIETANRGLAYFGKSIPDNPKEADKKRKKILSEISSKKIDIWKTILKMPFTRERKSKIELSFYSELIPDLYMSGLVPQLYLSAAQSTQHCLSGGMDESVIYSFSIMGLALGEEGEFEQAFKYEDLARNLSAKYPNTFGATRGMNGIVWCNMHSRSHPKDIIDYCLKSIQSGKNCGDLYNAGLSYGPLMWNLQIAGRDFSIIEDYARECREFSERYHLAFSVGLAEAMQAGWIEPMKRNNIQIPMNQKLRVWERDNHIASCGSYFVHRGMSHYYLGEYEKAEEALSEVKKYLSGLTDNVLKRQWYVFRVLNDLALYEKGKGYKTKRKLLARINPLIEKIEIWANLGPLLKPYLSYLYAELERVTGNSREARNLYLDAINIAHKQGYIFLEGQLNESFGKLLQKEKQSNAVMFFNEARRLYKECKAERKEFLLIDKYPVNNDEEKTIYPRVETEISPSRILPNLDVEYFMKASLAISSQIEQKALLKKIINVVMECSGAQAGYLLIENNGQLLVRAQSHDSGKERVKICNIKLEETQNICKAIVRYVHRTGERLLLNNASKEGLFKDNAEVSDLRLRSVLCMPVVREGKTVAILYLENRLSESVFNLEKTGMTEILASYAAVSLENASLFEELKNTSEALRKSERHWITTLTSIGDAVIATDITGRITFMNTVAEKLTGWTLQEVVNKSIRRVFRIINQYTRKNVGNPVDKVLENGAVVGLANHTILIRKDATEIPIDDSGAPIRDLSGNIIGVVLVFRDITARKKSEEELMKSEAKFKALYDANIIGVVHGDLQGNIFEANDAFLQIIGYARKDLQKGEIKWNKFTPSEYTSLDNKMGQELLKKGTVSPWEKEYIRKDGTRVPVIIGKVLISKDTTETISFVLDITERKKIDLRKDEFIGIASHELKTPITIIKAFTEILQRRFEKSKNQQNEYFARSINDQVVRLTSLVNDLLDVSKIQAGKMKFNYHFFDLDDLVKKTILDFQYITKTHKFERNGELKRKLYGDQERIRQVLVNLLSNAVKYSPNAERVIINLLEYKDEVRVSIQDFGLGIPESNQEKIFERFYRCEQRVKKNIPGFGIGLYISREIIQRHGGELWLESKVRKGSIFHFTLPIQLRANIN